MLTIKVPRRFFIDHDERGLPSPQILKATKTHFVVAGNDPALQDLLSDAEYYAHQYGPEAPWLKSSARATITAIKKAISN